jgi:hypothetical protein
MESGDEIALEDAVNEIASLLAKAYRRRAKIRLVHSDPELILLKEVLDCSPDGSVHEQWLTGQERESKKS